MVCAAVTNAVRSLQATIARVELQADDFTTWRAFVRSFVFDRAAGETSGNSEDEDRPISREEAVAFFRKRAGVT